MKKPILLLFSFAVLLIQGCISAKSGLPPCYPDADNSALLSTLSSKDQLLGDKIMITAIEGCKKYQTQVGATPGMSFDVVYAQAVSKYPLRFKYLQSEHKLFWHMAPEIGAIK